MSTPTTLPIPANTTCDIYRHGNAPPANPDVAGVKCYLAPYGQSTLTTNNYTHVLLVPSNTDVRDTAGPGSLVLDTANCDYVYVPNKNGTKFGVVLVRRVGLGTPTDHKRVILQRQATTFPTDNV
jgi:hypothetical protein